MATMISNGGALDSNSLGITQFLTATSYSNSATQIVASFGGGRLQILLGSFVFDGAGALIGGTITSIVETVPGGSSYQVSGLSLPVTSFLGFLNPPNGPGLSAALFGGNDGFLGNSGSDTLNGGTGADSLAGLDGNDVLDGGTGVDQLVGGKGNDTYFVDSFSDQVIESGNEGNDTVISTVSNGIAPSVENLTLVGTATLAQGNELANVISGNAQANTILGMEGNDTLFGADGDDGVAGGIGNDSLSGGNGNDTLDGESGDDTLDGGAGKDKMSGGDGNDVYLVDNALDTVIELAGKGTDAVFAAIDHQLASNVENLTLAGNAITGTGNNLGNNIGGNSLGNQLYGLVGNDTIAGGDGKDTLDGGEGHDSLLGGGGDDYLGGDLATGSGNDTIDGGAGADSIDGGHGDDKLYGDFGAPEGAANDTLDGGSGADTMNGGLGDDLYLVEGEGEEVAEFEEDGGIDTVLSTGSFTLGSGIENLTLKDGASSGNGNDLDNVITGNDLGNFLNGGNGNDTILAGAGDDFVNGNAGNDSIDGGDHDDNIEGGEGDDSIYGGAGNDFLLGGDGDDTVAGGIGSDTVAGQVGNDTLDGGAGADYLEGGKGDDAYYVDDTADVVREFAGEGTDTVFSTANFTLGLQFENLTLLGSDNANAIGNGADNLLIGNAGNNVLDGAGGNDTMAGGAGDDLYLVEGDDVIIENADEGFDIIWALSDHELGANIEILVAIGPGIKGIGNSLANEMYAFDAALYGLEGNDTLIGDFGNDTLIGGTGADSMAGGSGDDVYGVDSKFDLISELFGGGFDQVESSIDFELGENFEHLVLLNGATVGKGNSGYNQLQGNDGSNALFGNDGDDTIDGGAGNDTLDGGLGWDEMYGGLGDDLFLVDDESDYAYDANFDGGFDTVRSTAVSFTVGDNVERLELQENAWFGGGNELDNEIVGNDSENSLDGGGGNDTIQAGDGYDFLNGNAGNDILEGGDKDDYLTGGEDNDSVSGGNHNDNIEGDEGNDTLNGEAGSDFLFGEDGDDILDGGDGADNLQGGGGDDVFYFDNVQDFATEFVDEGIDTIRSTVTVSLIEQGGYIENVTLVGTADIGATGDSLANYLTGNKGDNKFEGLGGLDTMAGGAGDDTYFVQGSELIIENLNEGSDTVLAQANYQLAANIENLTVYEGHGGIEGKGNGLNNVMTSNEAGAALYGLGGADTMIGGVSADTLIGGTGADSMAGGAGDDIYGVDGKADAIVELAVGGRDTVQSSINYELGENLEDLVLLDGGTLGKGNNADNLILGNGGINGLFGGAGNDTLDGGAGADLLVGGSGNDLYVIDHGLDGVLEATGGGIDTVSSLVSYTLGANLENLTLLDDGAINGTGNGLANLMLGNLGNNWLRGNGGQDTLNGSLGLDTLTGGAGRDTFVRYSWDIGRDVITDFITGSNGDLLDISDIVSGYQPGASDINDFVRIVQSGSNSILQVDHNGATGGSAFEDVFTLSGVTTTVNDLAANGNLALA